MYTDAEGSVGYGACFRNENVFGRFIEEWNKANITFVELFPIEVALELWGHL